MKTPSNDKMIRTEEENTKGKKFVRKLGKRIIKVVKKVEEEIEKLC